MNHKSKICCSLSISLSASKQTASPLQGRRERGKNMRSIVFLITDPLKLPLKGEDRFVRLLKGLWSAGINLCSSV